MKSEVFGELQGIPGQPNLPKEALEYWKKITNQLNDAGMCYKHHSPMLINLAVCLWMQDDLIWKLEKEPMVDEEKKLRVDLLGVMKQISSLSARFGLSPRDQILIEKGQEVDAPGNSNPVDNY